MIEYLIALRRGECAEWTLTESSEVESVGSSDIVKCPVVGSMMRVVLRFLAPNWEQAKRVFDWRSLHTAKKLQSHVYTWEEIQKEMNSPCC